MCSPSFHHKKMTAPLERPFTVASYLIPLSTNMMQFLGLRHQFAIGRPIPRLLPSPSPLLFSQVISHHCWPWSVLKGCLKTQPCSYLHRFGYQGNCSVYFSLPSVAIASVQWASFEWIKLQMQFNLDFLVQKNKRLQPRSTMAPVPSTGLGGQGLSFCLVL